MDNRSEYTCCLAQKITSITAGFISAESREILSARTVVEADSEYDAKLKCLNQYVRPQVEERLPNNGDRWLHFMGAIEVE